MSREWRCGPVWKMSHFFTCAASHLTLLKKHVIQMLFKMCVSIYFSKWVPNNTILSCVRFHGQTNLGNNELKIEFKCIFTPGLSEFSVENMHCRWSRGWLVCCAPQIGLNNRNSSETAIWRSVPDKWQVKVALCTYFRIYECLCGLKNIIY